MFPVLCDCIWCVRLCDSRLLFPFSWCSVPALRSTKEHELREALREVFHHAARELALE